MKPILITESRKDFLENWKSIYASEATSDFVLTQELKCLDLYAKQTKTGYYISNWKEFRFEHVNFKHLSSFREHRPEKYINEGYSYSWQQLRNKYIDFGIQGYRSITLKLMNNYPLEERNKIEIYLDYFYKEKPGQDYFFRILQHSKVLQTDKENNPAFLINFCCNIYHLKKKENTSLAVKLPDGGIRFYKFDVNTNSIFDYGPLSDREFSILHLLAKGLNSKQISDILFISPNTVDTHRRNLLEITNCIDSTALVTYASMLGLIT